MSPSGNYDQRQETADSLAEAHALWYKEFGHRYLFMLSNKTNLSMEQTLHISSLILLNDIAGALRGITNTLGRLENALRPVDYTGPRHL